MSIPVEYTAAQDKGVAEIELADGTKVPLSFPERTIIVTHMEVERTGRSARGKEWTLYKLFATETDGTPIGLSLRTFENLKRGPAGVVMEAYVKNGGVEHYTVKLATRPQKRVVRTPDGRPKNEATVEGACPGCAALEVRLTAVERRINAALRGLED